MGKLTRHNEGNKYIENWYFGNILIYKSHNFATIKDYYSTGVPKDIEKWDNITPEEKNKLKEELKYLKDWEKIYKNPSTKTEHNGRYKIYSPNGNIYADFNFKNGYLNGEQKQYFWNSNQLYSIVNYKMGKQIGTKKSFYPNGQLFEVVNDNIIKRYEMNGKISYEYDKKTEIFKTYFDGKLSGIYYYRGDEPIETYYYDGKIKFSKVKKIVFGEEKTVNTKWYYDGKIKEEVIIALPDPTNSGKYMTWTKEYYSNGNLKYEKRDYYQVYEKIERFYDEKGKLKKTLKN